jgi:hypothetical protein
VEGLWMVFGLAGEEDLFNVSTLMALGAGCRLEQ